MTSVSPLRNLEGIDFDSYDVVGCFFSTTGTCNRHPRVFIPPSTFLRQHRKSTNKRYARHRESSSTTTAAKAHRVTQGSVSSGSTSTCVAHTNAHHAHLMKCIGIMFSLYPSLALLFLSPCLLDREHTKDHALAQSHTQQQTVCSVWTFTLFPLSRQQYHSTHSQ